MKLASGRLLSRSGRGVFGATVELFSGDSLRESVITNRNGEFSFHVEERDEQAKLFVRPLDRNGKTLAAAQPAARRVEWTIDPGQLANAALPPQATGRRAIDRAVFDTIDLAIRASFAPAQVASAQAILQAIDCALPPIDRFDDLLDVADGVLRGRSDDIRAFADRLDDMELWNQRNNPAPRRRINEKQAKALLTKKFLEDYSAKIHAARGPRTREGILGKRDGIVLLVAAIRTAGGDARRIHRNLGILADQFCGLRGLDRLYGAAFGALAGGLAERLRFVDALLLLGGICEPGGFPSREPSPPPCGSPSWPVDADDPEIPGDFPTPVEHCTAEALLAVREALGRQITYTITGITPATGACPGSVITITGTNLTFEGNVPDVLFSGRPRGTQIRATPAFASDTEIRVVVPPGAACGDLELDVPGGAASVLACDTTIELFSGPETPFHFSGGRTTIEFFTPSTTQDCLDAGRELVFSWRVCNAEEVLLRIRTDDGDVLLHETVVGHSFVFTVPELDRDTRVTATLLAAGPCGRDAERLAFTFHRGTPFGLDEAVPFTPVPFVNWHGNVRRGRVGIAVPSSLAQLVASVRTAELFGTRIGVQGSLWSYTDCVAPRRTTPLMVDIRLLGAALTNVLPAARRATVRSVLSSEVLAANFPMIRDTADRLVHVEAGIKIHALNCLLDAAGLALPTMGGDMGQSIAGAINTGTHGGTPQLPPISDLVRAVHLVGPAGRQWWIEPAGNPVTEADAMAALKADGTLDPCLNVIYDDNLFRATLVAAGSAGIVYSYVLEAVDAHNLASTTTAMSWAEAQGRMRDLVVTPETPTPWFLEVTVNPTRQARLTTRAITTVPPPAPPIPPSPVPPAPPPDPLFIAFLSFLFGPGAVGAIPVVIGLGAGAVATLNGALTFYIARRTADIIRYFTNPFEWWRIPEIEEEIELIQRAIATLASAAAVITGGGRETDLANLMPNLLNVVRQMGFYVVDGLTILDTAQNIFTGTLRPEGTTPSQKNYVAMTGQIDCAISTAPPTPAAGLLPPSHHSAFFRLIESFEYVLPADDSIEFADDVLRLADRVRATNDAVIAILNIRFTRATRALLGMQQFDKSGHVEIYTVRGLAGNDAFHRGLHELAASYGAIPHWGQFHDATTDFAALYGEKLERWRAGMDRIARGGGGPLNTFRHDFAIRRGLLTAL